VIYVRVSTNEQTENLTLPTQLKACEEYYQCQGFHVLARFREEGARRLLTAPSCKSSVQFCRTNKGRVQFVVFNMTRFARDPPSPCGLRRARQGRPFSRAVLCCSRSAFRCVPRRNRSTTRR